MKRGGRWEEGARENRARVRGSSSRCCPTDREWKPGRRRRGARRRVRRPKPLSSAAEQEEEAEAEVGGAEEKEGAAVAGEAAVV